ncbi:unnamed protein product [Rangifer tarandus platyrhynchus]|uniref:WAS/WASL interacting protein family, member 3 n=2 Tax=Rangifer tarandus platyrhynchus TaxID=3082113 RepID=A0ABN8ZID9_RANTA|nr:unnamed protein product [Rangifer tarandus platyrhynchus]CAI9708195.1 unnamed protein product [Rangifer tarandus platyrhynchus]
MLGVARNGSIESNVRPLLCTQEPRDSGGWRGLLGKPCQQPPARQEHLPIRGFRDQLCLSAILKSSDIFQRQGGKERRKYHPEVPVRLDTVNFTFGLLTSSRPNRRDLEPPRGLPPPPPPPPPPAPALARIPKAPGSPLGEPDPRFPGRAGRSPSGSAATGGQRAHRAEAATRDLTSQTRGAAPASSRGLWGGPEDPPPPPRRQTPPPAHRQLHSPPPLSFPSAPTPYYLKKKNAPIGAKQTF